MVLIEWALRATLRIPSLLIPSMISPLLRHPQVCPSASALHLTQKQARGLPVPPHLHGTH